MARVVLRLLAVAAALPLAGAADADADADFYVTDLDRMVMADAVEAKNQFCEGGLKGEVDYEDRSVMEDQVGDENIMLKVLTKATSQDDLPTVAQEEMQGEVIGTAIAKIAFGFVLIVFWFFCSLWSCCPCCKRCRCGKQRNTSFLTKIIALACCGVIGFVIILVSGLGTAAFGTIIDGFDNLACTAASLLDGLLAGQTDPYFMGVVPVLEEFKGMEDSLDVKAPFMTSLGDVIDSTSVIEDSVTLVSQTLLLLESSLELPSEVKDNFHTCKLCESLAPTLVKSSSALQNGVASSLASARVEVKGQLQGENAKVLADTMRAAAEPIIEVKNLLRDTLAFFTDTEKFMQLRDIMDGTVRHVVNGIISLALLLVAFVGLTAVLWIFKAGPLEEPTRTVPRWAGCNWCCGFLFAIFTFIIGGIMSAMSFGLSGVCLIMDDMSVPLLRDISPALGVNTTGESKEQLFDIIDACIVPADRNSNALLLDIVKTRDNASAPLVTLRKQIVDDVKSTIQSQFDEIGTKMQGNNSLETDPAMVSLMGTLKDTPLDSMLLFLDASLFTSDDTYKPMAQKATLRDAALNSSLACADGESSMLPNTTLTGIDTYLTELSKLAATTSDVAGSCVKDVTCPASGANRAPCVAGKDFLKLKSNIRQASFKCNVFANPDDKNLACDPKDMASTKTNGKTSWTNTCQKADGTLTVKKETCDFDQWVTHVRDFHVRIRKSLKRVDTLTEEKGSSISDDMLKLVRKYIFVPIDRIASGVACGFLGQYYRKVVDGMCYQGLVGFAKLGTAYQAVGGITLILTFLTFAIWRVTYDNVEAVRKATPEGFQGTIVCGVTGG